MACTLPTARTFIAAKVGGDVRCAAEICARGARSCRARPDLRDWLAAQRRGVASIERPGDASGLPEMAGARALLRFHNQWISLRQVPRRACEGAGLRARLDEAPAARIHEPAL